MEERWILFGLHEMEGIGKKTISKLILGQHELPDLLNYGESDWVAAGLRKDQAARLTSQFTIDWIESKREHVYNQGIEVITYLDQNYPILMKETVQPPWVMYARGDVGLLHNSSIAMVGTRMPTVYGRKVGEKLAEQLCNAGLTIVSGLAAVLIACVMRQYYVLKEKRLQYSEPGLIIYTHPKIQASPSELRRRVCFCRNILQVRERARDYFRNGIESLPV